ncbi:MAG: DUF2092 domain-containing protein [Paracoccaceae bacterium]
MVNEILVRGLRLSAAAALSLSCAAGAVLAQSAAPSPAVEDPPAVEPEAIQAMTDMGAKLRDLTAFSVKANLIWEEAFESGEKTAIIEQVSIEAQKPKGLRVERSSPQRQRIFYFNGEQATLWAPEIRFYTMVDFSGTNAEMIVDAAEKYDYQVPLADLFLWGLDPSQFEAITAARYVGQAQFGDRVCDQYAFRQENVDWQVWIEDSEAGLPCGYMIVDLTDEAHPVFQATVEVTPVAEFADSRFTFVAPEDATAIPFETTKAAE